MKTTIVLPCYNPPQDWEKRVVTAYSSFSSVIGEKPELVIVLDGHSKSVKDDALNYLKQQIEDLHVVSYEINKGKGYAIRQGVAKATGEIILYTDIDFPYTQDSMLLLYNSLKDNVCEVAVGVKNTTYYSHVPYVRRMISYFLRFLISIFLSMPITDTQCGLKGFRSNIKPVFLKTTINRYLFDLEFIRNCFKAKQYKVLAIPVALKDDIHFIKMNYRVLFHEMLNFAKLLFTK